MTSRRRIFVSAGVFVAAAMTGWSGMRALRHVASPLSTLAEAPVAVAYVSMGCAASRRLVAALERARRDDVVTISIDDSTSRFARGSCRRALRVAERFGNRWVRVLPEDWACRLLYEDAAAYWSEHFTWVPAFSKGGVPMYDAPFGASSDAPNEGVESSRLDP